MRSARWSCAGGILSRPTADQPVRLRVATEAQGRRARKKKRRGKPGVVHFGPACALARASRASALRRFLLLRLRLRLQRADLFLERAERRMLDRAADGSF